MHFISRATPVGRAFPGIKKMAGLLAAFGFVASSLLAPGVASAQEATLRQSTQFPALQLKAHERGERAVAALGTRLPEVAAWYGKSPKEFADTLRRDPLARIDREGRVYYVEQFPAAPQQASGVTGDAGTVANGAYPPEQTFQLHSRPGANRVIYLDFNGHLATGTAWNSSYGLSAIDAQAFDLDGIPSTFSATELDRIQYIWQRVAEDYAAFDVDVTTEEPPADALTRSSSTDVTFGTRVVITRDWTSSTANPCGCGGFAYLGVFDDTTEYYKPAFVFFDRLGGGNEKYVAEATSHEAGHNLGLNHDGTTTGTAYYAGHGSGATGWAPIMGVGYYKELVQWSKGEYPNANNTEDDIARIQQFGAPLRVDDHGNASTSATPLNAVTSAGVVALSGSGVITTRSDVDVFSFTSSAGPISLTITPAPRGPNLDVVAELLDASGNLVATVNPVDALNATINVSSAPAGTYYLKIDGTGKGDLTTGYSDYGSLGAYTVSGSANAGEGQPPVALASATPVSGTVPLTVNFSSAGSYDPDGSAISYSWNFGDGSALSTVSNPSHVYNAAGNYTATLKVTDATGMASVATLLISVAGSVPTMHVESIGMALSVNRSGARATATVTVLDASGRAVPGASVSGVWSGVVSGSKTATTATSGTAKFTSPTSKSRGTFTFTVTGVTLSGYAYDAAQNKQTSASIVY